MLNRLTVSALLKAVILATALVVVAGFSLRAWDSFNQLQSANRIVRVANASADVVKAMNNLRADRPPRARAVTAEQPISPEIETHLRDVRDSMMPALGRALA